MRILNCSLMLTAQLEHLFNHKVAVFYLSQTLLPLQHCNLTYISKQTSRNGGDDILKLSGHVRATYLFIHVARGSNAFCQVSHWHAIGGWHALSCHQSSMNIRTVGGGGEACWAARKQMVFAPMTDARLLPRITAQTQADQTALPVLLWPCEDWTAHTVSSVSAHVKTTRTTQSCSVLGVLVADWGSAGL